METDLNRRRLMRSAAGAALALPLTLPALAHSQTPKEAKPEEEVSPAEDLMREHGVLNRALLIYEEVDRRLTAGTAFDPKALIGAATLIRAFIEDYHEKLEEEFLFPRFRKAGRLVELVNTLEAQHRAGRSLTAAILSSTGAGQKPAATQAALRAFVRLYRPHEAREDTVLFPELRKIVSGQEYDALGEEFERREHQKFGEEGFERAVERVAAIEKQLGIYDLAQFTPAAAR